jgi:hypothetical protein
MKRQKAAIRIVDMTAGWCLVGIPVRRTTSGSGLLRGKEIFDLQPLLFKALVDRN